MSNFWIKKTSSELHNLTLSLDTFWGRKAYEMREKIMLASSPKQKFSVLETYLLSQAKRSINKHPAVAFALKTLPSLPHSGAISEVIAQTGLSSRRFIELFSKQVGLSPKLYSRICRFQQALQLINQKEKIDWLEVALECGYFDQSHFIHDFRAFSGLSPTAYELTRGEHLNHVPIK